MERFNKTLLKIIRIPQLQGKNWKREVQDFLFHFRSTPHTVTSLSPAELLVGRKLRDKLPQVQSPHDQATEAEWQILLRERYAWRKLREKEYADSKRHPTTSDIAEGDLVLLCQNRENKLPPTFEPEPYHVLEKNGNAVVIKNSAGQSKMRNAGHMKKFVDLGTEKGATDTERGLFGVFWYRFIDQQVYLFFCHESKPFCHPDIDFNVRLLKLVLKTGEYSWIFHSFSWGIFSHMTGLDQSRASENI